MKDDLTILREARELLEHHYIPWNPDDGKGGGCLQLAVVEYVNSPLRQTRAGQLIDTAAQRMHPELAGEIRPRAVIFGRTTDSFDVHPAVFVNNHLGKEAILAVVADAILHEEMRVMLEKEQAAIWNAERKRLMEAA